MNPRAVREPTVRGARPRAGPLSIFASLLVVVGLVLTGPALLTGGASEIGGPLAGLTPEELARFAGGAAVFSKVHGPGDGLGPLFNGRACAECQHLAGARRRRQDPQSPDHADRARGGRQLRRSGRAG